MIGYLWNLKSQLVVFYKKMLDKSLKAHNNFKDF
jgi:hypothetical protein